MFSITKSTIKSLYVKCYVHTHTHTHTRMYLQIPPTKKRKVGHMGFRSINQNFRHFHTRRRARQFPTFNKTNNVFLCLMHSRVHILYQVLFKTSLLQTRHLLLVVILEGILIAFFQPGKGEIHFSGPPDLSSCQCNLNPETRCLISTYVNFLLLIPHLCRGIKEPLISWLLLITNNCFSHLMSNGGLHCIQQLVQPRLNLQACKNIIGARQLEVPSKQKYTSV